MPKTSYQIGDENGNLKILLFKSESAKFKRRRTLAVCLCKKCGRRDYEILPYNFKKQKSCGCDRVWNTPPAGKLSKLFRGYEGISALCFNNIRRRAERKNIEFSVGIEYLWNLYLHQKGECAITGVPISLDSRNRGIGVTASLDRIDSAKGYTKKNVQWVHVEINYMKHNLPMDTFLYWCHKVVNNSKI